MSKIVSTILTLSSVGAIVAGSQFVAPKILAERPKQDVAAQSYYECGEVEVSPDIDPTETISIDQQATIDRNNHTEMVAAFWHEQSAEACRPWGQSMGYKNELGTLDVGDWLSAPLAQENIKYIVLVDGEGSRIYTLDQLKEMGWNDYQQYVKNMRTATDQLSADQIPDGPKYDLRVADIEAQRINTKPKTAFTTEIVDRLSKTGGMVQGEWLFENSYPGS
jgi:hypothetical protein